MEDRLFMGTRSMGQGSGGCPQVLGSLIAGALAASIIGREAGRLNTSSSRTRRDLNLTEFADFNIRLM